MLLWWVVDDIINHSDKFDNPWWQLHTTSLFMTITQVLYLFYMSILKSNHVSIQLSSGLLLYVLALDSIGGYIQEEGKKPLH